MKLTDVTLSYPFIQYRIDVTHFTARRSTAIEWLILEAVQRVQQIPEYSGMSIENFFSLLFGITDTNKMIRPCLLNLRDIGALRLDSVYDQTDMSETTMGQLHLTDVGASMQKDGKLPGADSTDRIRFFYHVLANQLSRDSKTATYQDKPNGIMVRELESVDEVAFPEPLARQTLEALKQQKERPSWLENETSVQQITPVESELIWKNVPKSLVIGSGLICSVEGNDNPAIDSAALSGIDFGITSSSLPYIQVSDPDNELKAITPSNQLQSLIDRIDIDGSMLIVDSNYRLDGIRSFTSGKGNVSIRFFCNAEDTKLKIERSLITVYLPENLLPNGLVYLDKNQAVGHGLFSLTAGSVTKIVELAYIPKESGVDVKATIISYIENNYVANPSLLHIYRALGMQNVEMQIIESYCHNLKSIEDKIRFLTQLNDESLTLFKSKSIGDEVINDLILDKDGIQLQITDASSALQILRNYTSVDVVKKRPSTMEALLRIVLNGIKHSESLSDVIEILSYIQSVGKQYIKFIKQENLWQTLYSDNVLREMISMFANEDFYSLEEFTQYESVLRDMRNAVDRTQELLEISLMEETSENHLIEAVLLHRSELETIVGFLELWRSGLEVFNSRFGDFSEMSTASQALTSVDKNYQKLSSVLSMFCCDKSLRYSRICILDTNSLMHMPELFELLDGKDTMVIVPQMMLSELDGLKKDEDEEVAYQAREAIRVIDNYSAFDWINLKEESNIDLLSNDLDPDNPDCRIISVALKYIIHKPILITDDTNMRNLAKSQGITTMTTEGFSANIQQAEREHKQEKNTGKKNKKKKKR